MQGPTLTDPVPSVPLGPRRAEVLARLREAPGPLSVQDVSDQTGLHINTARFHLDGLVADGLAERTTEERELPGRPRILYTAGPGGPGPRSFALLAEMLTGLVATLEGSGPAAVEAGRAWGRHLVSRPAPSERVEPREAVARLERVLEGVGFDPQVRLRDGVTEVLLRNCPFREVAERHTDVVCGLHRGLIDGALGELRAGLSTERLDPFVTPTLCVARLRPGAAGPRRRRTG